MARASGSTPILEVRGVGHCEPSDHPNYFAALGSRTQEVRRQRAEVSCANLRFRRGYSVTACCRHDNGTGHQLLCALLCVASVHPLVKVRADPLLTFISDVGARLRIKRAELIRATPYIIVARATLTDRSGDQRTSNDASDQGTCSVTTAVATSIRPPAVTVPTAPSSPASLNSRDVLVFRDPGLRQRRRVGRR